MEFKGYLKKTIDKWYTETFNETKEDNLVTDTKFCNDRSESYAAVEKRIYTNSPQPTLKCINEQDEVPAKAGLITADEIIYAGGLYKIGVTNNKTYLDNNTNFWTISPRLTPRAYGWNSIQKYIGSDLTNPSDNSTSARPVITLSSNATVTFDESSQYKAGTKDNPYKVIIK